MKLFRTTDHATTDDETAYDENADTAVSQESVQPVADTRPVSSGLARESEAAAEPTTTYQDGATPDQEGGGSIAEPPQPTFTPAPATPPGGIATSASSIATSAGSTVASVRPDLTDEGGDFTRPLSAVAPVNDETPADDPTLADDATAADDRPATFPASASGAPGPMDEPVAAFTADEPLLANSAGMRASWQKVQAEFVDDPQAAVRGAADLIEQAAQSLADALAQRQRQLRESITGDPAGSGSGGTDGPPDTEHLRLLMQRYRTLFNQLSKA